MFIYSFEIYPFLFSYQQYDSLVRKKKFSLISLIYFQTDYHGSINISCKWKQCERKWKSWCTWWMNEMTNTELSLHTSSVRGETDCDSRVSHLTLNGTNMGLKTGLKKSQICPFGVSPNFSPNLLSLFWMVHFKFRCDNKSWASQQFSLLFAFLP